MTTPESPTLADVDRGNPRAQALYARFGFARHNRDLMTCLVNRAADVA